MVKKQFKNRPTSVAVVEGLRFIKIKTKQVAKYLKPSKNTVETMVAAIIFGLGWEAVQELKKRTWARASNGGDPKERLLI